MFIGHFGPAFLAASLRKSPSLGIPFAACQAADLIFFGLSLAGIEHFRITPGITAMNPMDLYDFPWSHSLLALAGWAALFGILAWAALRDHIAAMLIGLAVLSHWPLDYLVHAPDMTLAGGPPALGLALWNVPAAEAALEILITFGALALYRARTTGPRLPITMLSIFLIGAQIAALVAPQPTVETPQSVIAIGSLATLFVLIALGWWTGKTRTPKSRAS